MYALLYHSRGRNCTTGIFILKTLSFMFRLSYKSLSGCIVIQKSGINMDMKHVNKCLQLILIYSVLFYFISVLHRNM